MSIEAVARALVVPIGGTKKIVLVGLANHAHPDGSHAYPAVETLATYACCDRRTVQRALRELEALGLVEGEEREGRATSYRLLFVGGGEMPPPQVTLNGGGGTHAAGGAAPTPPEPSTNHHLVDADASTSPIGVSTDVERLCVLLSYLTRLRLELPDSSTKYVVTDAWRRDMRLLIEKDRAHVKDPVREVEAAIRWVDHHDFWSKNILSPSKLRKQYDRLVLEAKKQKPTDTVAQRKVERNRARERTLRAIQGGGGTSEFS